jgi:hypothetical protein
MPRDARLTRAGPVLPERGWPKVVIRCYSRVILEFFTGISRKFVDQARSLEKSEQLRRAA